MLTRLGSTFRLAMCVCALAGAATARAADQQTRIQHVVDDLKTQLSIAQPVNVAIVESNPKLLSVVPVAHTRATFLLSVEADFAQGLSEDERRAAVQPALGPL